MFKILFLLFQFKIIQILYNQIARESKRELREDLYESWVVCIFLITLGGIDPQPWFDHQNITKLMPLGLL